MAEVMVTAPRNSLGALSPRYMGWMLMPTPGRVHADSQTAAWTPSPQCPGLPPHLLAHRLLDPGTELLPHPIG